MSITTASLGHFDFKNVDRPMEVFALTNEGLSVPQRKSLEGKLKEKKTFKRNMIAIAVDHCTADSRFLYL